MKTIFIRVVESTDKESALLAAVQQPKTDRGIGRFDVDSSNFSAVPGSPFAYWVSGKTLKLFEALEPLNHDERLVVSTNPLNDDFRYVRSWWEVNPKDLGQTWMPWAKGGAYSPYYYDIDTVISWDDDRSTYFGFVGTENRPLQRPASVQHFLRPGLTWPRRTNGLSLRVLPRGSIFADKGPAVFVASNDGHELLELVAITNSSAFALLVSLQLARTELAQSYEVGLIQNTPVPRVSSTDRHALAELGGTAWKIKRSLDTSTETSHSFVVPGLLQVPGDDLASRVKAWNGVLSQRIEALHMVQSKIDERCFALYNIDANDRFPLSGVETEPGTTPAASTDVDVEAVATPVDDGDLKESLDGFALSTQLVSWAVGVAFGRFDVRVASNGSDQKQEPFDALPACSPAMLIGPDHLPTAIAPKDYPVGIYSDGILVHDPGHQRDLAAAVQKIFEQVFKERGDVWWSEVGNSLPSPGGDVRSWLASNFFDYNIKRYSKSRRKAPIYWQLSIPSGRFSIWVYAHRLSRDSFIQLQNDVMGPKLAHEVRQLNNMMAEEVEPSGKQRKEIEAQETLVEELRGMLDEVTRVVPLWSPSIDDGITLTMAPLWRLVPQHRGWQKELKSRWLELEAGKHDWSHIAMHLWPERVIAKCAQDRSLAIAHGFEETFWYEYEDGKWQPIADQKLIDRCVRDHSNPSVKAALKNFSEAPDATSAQKTNRKRRAA
jgi:hypothetical protein